ncbi:MAG: type IV toxin-antitoxin system AbiEi family antitoxin [Streptosporangiaceae bacterium]
MEQSYGQTRKATASVAPVLEQLELRQPKVVARELMADVLAIAGSHLRPRDAVERLVREGWLLPLRTRGAWEFAPASRAGRYPSGDPWIELRAQLARYPDAPVAVAFASAVWALGCTSHQPTRPTLAHRRGWRPPRALGDARSISYDWWLPPWDKDGLPVWQPAIAVVAAAVHPDAQQDWGNADEWLPETMRAATPTDVRTEARGKSASALARLGYLAEWSGCHEIVEVILALLPRQPPVSYLGPRRDRHRWVKRWRLYDSLLPQR